jgi:hypothetical protein
MFGHDLPMAMENAHDFYAIRGHPVERHIVPDNDVPDAGHDVVSFHAQIRKMRQPQPFLMEASTRRTAAAGLRLAR